MIEFKNFTITDIGGSIFKIIVFEGADIEEADILQLKLCALELANGKKYAILLDGTHTFSISPTARALVASKEFSKDRIAGAFVITSLANKLLGNFFIKFNKPASPTKLFSDEASAMEWLKEQFENVNKLKSNKGLKCF